MKLKLVFSIILTFSLFSIVSEAADIVPKDSVKISNTVMDFYSWYLTAIKEKRIDIFQPTFIADKNGMTTLTDSVYIENLSMHHFSDSLIMKERQSYNDCINTLKTVKFSNFGKNVYIDLDEYENSDCDFANYFRWIGGQEPIDGIKIIKIFIKNNIGKVTFQNYNHDPIKNENFYWGENTVYMIKVAGEWYINDIESWNQSVYSRKNRN
jgi:hypothetical protein